MQVLSKMLKVPIAVYTSVTEQGGRGGGFTALGRWAMCCAVGYGHMQCIDVLLCVRQARRKAATSRQRL